jgi:hypothetical protein
MDVQERQLWGWVTSLSQITLIVGLVAAISCDFTY